MGWAAYQAESSSGESVAPKSIPMRFTFVEPCNAPSEEADLHPVELQATGRSGDL
jgi:hypothetical protein